MMRIFRLVVMVFVMIVLFSLLVPGCKTETATNQLDIGVASTLTGPAGVVGTNVLHGIQMAIDDQNSLGGITIAGKKYLLHSVVRDDQYNPATCKVIVDELINKINAKIIFGPTPVGAVAVQKTANDNKVLLFLVSPQTEVADQPYVFAFGAEWHNAHGTVCDYTRKYYPTAKTVVNFLPDTADAEQILKYTQEIMDYYGFSVLATERFPFPTTTDFAPFAQRVLSYKPDIIDLNASAAMLGPGAATMIKQIREAGFEGIIMCPTPPPPDIMATLPSQYLYKIVTNEYNIDGPVVPQAYRDLNNRYVNQYKDKPIDQFFMAYNGAYGLIKFLDGQNTMDTTQWMEGFAKYKWHNDIYDKDFQWVGKPIFGIDRMLVNTFWASEWKNGQLETNFVSTLPNDLWTSK